MKKKKIKLITSIVSAITIILGVVFAFQENGNIDKNEVEKAVDIVTDAIVTYNMTNEEVKELPTTKIEAQTEAEEKKVGEEQSTTETEGFELQGEIAYEGDRSVSWNAKIGDYKGLTYYSQLDSRWKNKLYTSTGKKTQTIGSSGCGPTSAAMVITTIRGSITPDKVADLFVEHGYRSANNGTYLSAFRAIADEFIMCLNETTNLDGAVEMLRDNFICVASCGTGLFTSGGHYIVIVGVEGNTLKIYDPYLYAGKFETSTRRGKVTVKGNTVYCSIDNFRKYANAQYFFAYQNTGESKPNNDKPVTTAEYTRYVKANGGLNVRNKANGSKIGLLKNGTKVKVKKTSGNWSYITSPQKGWVCSDYLVTTKPTTTKVKNTVGQKKKTKACTLYSNSNLSGTRYTYKANTTVTILQNVNNKVDKIKVNYTGRVAYINKNNYK